MPANSVSVAVTSAASFFVFVLASARYFSPVGMPAEDSSILEDEASAPPVCLSILPSSFAIQEG